MEVIRREVPSLDWLDSDFGSPETLVGLRLSILSVFRFYLQKVRGTYVTSVISVNCVEVPCRMYNKSNDHSESSLFHS